MPIPAQGGQQQYTERPYKIFAEQYRAGGALPIGAIAAIEPIFPASGGPYANTLTGVFPLHDTDWVITNRYTGQQQSVMANDEFTERFGSGGGPPLPA
jgi:hypothetical protein